MSMTAPMNPIDPSPAGHSDVAQVVADAREVADARSNQSRTRDDRLSAAVLGGGFLMVCASLLATWEHPSWHDAMLTILLGFVHGVASRVTFESSGGSAVPTAPIFAAALFLVPLPLVPVVVLIGLLSSSWGTDAGSGRLRWLLVASLSGWNSIGPVLVLAVLDAEPALSHWPWYVAAMASQFLTDALVASVRVRSLGMSWRVLPRPLVWTYAVDSMLAPVGLTAVIACEGSIWSVLIASTPIGVLALLARDRAEHLEKAVVISEAFDAAITTARLDALTGIGNRRAWNEATARAAVEFAADPMFSKVSVVMGDLDGLKRVNDTFGHEAGDELIRAAARAFAAAAPPGALVARLGGDEFGMLVIGATVQSSELIGAIRREVRVAAPVHGVALSLSLGAASCPPMVDVEAALHAADSLAFADKAARRVSRG
jgi:diguanylate cyclase (GGDEF)-like protein